MRPNRLHARVVALIILATVALLALGMVGVVSAGPADATEPSPVAPPPTEGCSQPSGDQTQLLLSLFFAIADTVLF